MSGYRVTPHRTAGQGRRTASPRGVTLIEAVLFISVALGLIVGGIVFYQQSLLASRSGAQLRALSSLVTETIILLRQPSGAGVTTSLSPDNVFAVARLLPDEYLSQQPGDELGSYLRTVWGTELYAEYQAFFPFTLIVVTLAAIPVGACSRLAATDADGRSTFGVEVFQVAVADVPVGASPGDVLLDAPVSIGAVASACADADAQGDGDGKVTVSISYLPRA